MKAIAMKIGALVTRLRLPAIACAAFALGYLLKGTAATAPPVPEASKEGTRKQYACAMFCVPPLPNPGDCPVCGMEMVEVDASTVAAGARTLTLSEAARKLAEIEVAPAERRFVSAEIRMVGKVDFDETRLKYITAWVPGRLDRLYVDYTGVPVAEGDHLVYMYSPELLVAQVELLRAIETAGDLREAADAGVRRSAEGLIENARKKLRLWGLSGEQVKDIETRGTPSDHMTIYSPIGGIVVDKNATEGMYVDTGTRIYTIADLSRLWVKLDAYESDLAWLRYGQTVEFETEAYPGEKFRGTVAFIDPVLSSKTRTVKVRVNVDNPDGRLKPQMFVRAVARAKLAESGLVVNAALAGKWISPMHPEVVKDGPGACDVCGMPLVRAETLGFVSKDDVEAEPPLVIPATAPLVTGKRALVYVEVPNKPGTYEGREVTLGSRAGDDYLVRGGLAEGEHVVVNGNFKIDSAVQIRAQSSMMNPGAAASAPADVHGGESGTAKAAARRFEVPSAFGTQLDAVFVAYFRIQKALSHDTLKDVKGAVGSLGRGLDGVDVSLLKGAAHEAWMKEADAIRKTAAGVAAAGDIEKARQSFALLSEALIGTGRRFGMGRNVAYRFRCSMAFDNRGADWLQDHEKTENPYFGSSMFRCGSMKETLGKGTAHEAGGDARDN